MPEDLPESSRSNQPIQEAQQKLQKAAGQATASKPERRGRAFLFQLYLAAAIMGFLGLAFYAYTIPYSPVDVWITQHFQRIEASWFMALMVAISWPGFTPQNLIIAMIIPAGLALLGFHWEAVVTGGAALSEGVLNTLIKALIHRTRPAEDVVDVIQQLASYSFPSGHVMFYTVFFGFLIFLAFTLLSHSWLRTALILFFSSLVLLVGPSRVFLGQHWASDVLGAYLLGSLWLVLVIRIYRWGKPIFFPRQPAAPEEP